MKMMPKTVVKARLPMESQEPNEEEPKARGTGDYEEAEEKEVAEIPGGKGSREQQVSYTGIFMI